MIRADRRITGLSVRPGEIGNTGRSGVAMKKNGMILAEYNFIFDPHLSVLRISQRKLRRKLSWLIYLLLICLGLYGIFVLAYFLLKHQGSLRIFYLSLFLF